VAAALSLGAAPLCQRRIHAASHRLRNPERELGGLPAAAQRELLSIAKGTQSAATSSKIKIKPGTKLLREWDGNTHEVLVTDKGFVWKGTTYGSLSAVAFAITGAKWSGQRFFGLLKVRGGQDD
jgi:hypothetical protein